MNSVGNRKKILFYPTQVGPVHLYTRIEIKTAYNITFWFRTRCRVSQQNFFRLCKPMYTLWDLNFADFPIFNQNGKN